MLWEATALFNPLSPRSIFTQETDYTFIIAADVLAVLFSRYSHKHRVNDWKCLNIHVFLWTSIYSYDLSYCA